MHSSRKAAKHADRHDKGMRRHHVATETDGESGVKVSFGPVLQAGYQAPD